MYCCRLKAQGVAPLGPGSTRFAPGARERVIGIQKGPTRSLRLVLATSVPAHVRSGFTDDRRLGVALAALTSDDGLTGARAPSRSTTPALMTASMPWTGGSPNSRAVGITLRN